MAALTGVVEQCPSVQLLDLRQLGRRQARVARGRIHLLASVAVFDGARGRVPALRPEIRALVAVVVV